MENPPKGVLLYGPPGTVDAFGGTRFGDGEDNEVQRTMLELINQLDGFDNRGNVKVLMATNRPDTLDPALLRPGRLDRKIEFGLPDLEGRVKILEINARTMSVEKSIRFDLLARLCNGATGAELRSVCIEAGMFAIRERRKIATEDDFFKAVDKVIKEGSNLGKERSGSSSNTKTMCTVFYAQSRYYRAPEVILGIPYTNMVDMWSFGCIAYEMICGDPLFPGKDNCDQINRIYDFFGNTFPIMMLDHGKNTTKYFNKVEGTYKTKISGGGATY
ncbi:unnamed protein product [Medioppia subpectinata]|uniref:Protein kinase domain-containing protein n=1 Tax=Medioppia subpectinata TaxID=1979941 RepID=A0A7R9KE65_9ACAR|nr:unnamed protein product [Medioppia subpectinata]CAG2100495.1 unnamed protein product [Medioppia subpectinata]